MSLFSKRHDARASAAMKAEQQEATPRNSRKDRMMKVGAPLAALAATVALGLSGCGETSGATPPDAGQVPATVEAIPSPTATETPETTPTTAPELALNVEALSIPYGPETTPEALASDVITRLDFWDNAGCSPDIINKFLNQPGDYVAFAQSESDKNAPIFADALLIDNYEQNPNLVAFYDAWKESNRVNTALYVITERDTQASEGFREWTTIESQNLMTNTDGSLTLDVQVVSHDNYDKMNGALDGDNINVRQIGWSLRSMRHFTLMEQTDGTLKISNVTVDVIERVS